MQITQDFFFVTLFLEAFSLFSVRACYTFGLYFLRFCCIRFVVFVIVILGFVVFFIVVLGFFVFFIVVLVLLYFLLLFYSMHFFCTQY